MRSNMQKVHFIYAAMVGLAQLSSSRLRAAVASSGVGGGIPFSLPL